MLIKGENKHVLKGGWIWLKDFVEIIYAKGQEESDHINLIMFALLFDWVLHINADDVELQNKIIYHAL